MELDRPFDASVSLHVDPLSDSLAREPWNLRFYVADQRNPRFQFGRLSLAVHFVEIARLTNQFWKADRRGEKGESQ